MSDPDQPTEPTTPASPTPEPATPEPQTDEPQTTEPQTDEPAPAAPAAAAPVAAAPGAAAPAPGWPAPPPGPARERPSRQTLLITVAVLAAITLILLITTAFALGRRGYPDGFGRGRMIGRMPGGCVQERSFTRTSQASTAASPSPASVIPVPPSGAPRFPGSFPGAFPGGRFPGGCGTMHPGGWPGTWQGGYPGSTG